MKSDIDKIKEAKFDFIEALIGRGVQYETCGKISSILNTAIESLAAPAVANGAAELPPLPEPAIEGSVMHQELKICYLAPVHFTADQMQAYGRAAIAASTQQAAPKVMLTDEKIFKLYQESHVEYDATVLVRNQFTEENEYQTQKQSCFSPLKFADAIYAAVVIAKGE